MKVDPEQPGRERLIQAAIALAAEKRSFADVGVRELTRAAGLSPGAFYRHFSSTDELGMSAVALVDDILRSSLQSLWDSMRGRGDLMQVSLKLYFDVALANQSAFVVCARERYGASETLRQAMRELQIGLSREMARELAQSQWLAGRPLAQLESASLEVIEHLNIYWLDYVVADAVERKRICQAAEAFVQRHLAGLVTVASVKESA